MNAATPGDSLSEAQPADIDAAPPLGAPRDEVPISPKRPRTSASQGPVSEGEEAGSLRRLLGRGASTSFVLQSAGNVLQYVTQALLTRTLSVTDFGVYTYALNWSRIGGSSAHLGGASSTLRFVPEYSVKGEWALVRGVVKRSRQVAVLVGLVATVIASILVLTLGSRSRESVALVLALSLVPVAALIEVQVALTRAFKRIFRAFFPWLVLQPILLIAGVLAAELADRRLTLNSALAVTAFSYAATIVVQGLWLRTSQPPQVRSAPPSYKMRSWAAVSLPIFGSNVVYLVFSRMDIVMVGLLMSPRSAGIYAVAMRVGSTTSILQTAMNSTVAPRISQLYWSEREGELRRLVLTAIRFTFVPSLLLTVVLCVFAVPVLHIFGPAYASGRTVLIVIALGQLVSVSSGPVGWLMNLTGHQNVTAVVFATTAAVTMVGYFVLIPTLGLIGAGLANGGAVAVRNIALNYVARRRLGYRISVIRSMRPA